jgi:acetolactate synthase-1/2/3 large subunit
MKLSDYIIKKISTYTNYAFTGQGGSVVHLNDSLSKNKKMKIIPAQNEQGASLAADAFYRASGKLGVVVATSGPGILNTLQGMACSYYDSIPGLYLSGAPVTGSIKKNKNLRQLGFQEMEVVDIVKSMTKYAVRLKKAEDIRYEIEKAVYYSLEGRPGPVLIDLPDDLQRQEINEKKLKSFKPNKRQIKINNSTLKKLNDLMLRSKRPIIILGNGIKISKTEKKFYKIIKKNKIPFATTWATTDLFDLNDKLNIGSFGVYATRHGNFSIQNSDLLLILGSRMNGTQIGTATKFAPNAKKVLVDIDKSELNEENKVKIDCKINLDLNNFVKIFEKSAKKIKIEKKWYKAISDWKIKYPTVQKKYFQEKQYTNPYVFFHNLSKFTKKNDIIIPDASANLVWFYQAYKPKKNQKIFTALNHSPMGYSFAAAIGAAVSLNSKKEIIAIIGDGSVQMNIQEIENIKNYKLPIKMFIIDNQGYGMVKQTIDTWLKKNYVGCDKSSGLSIPNFLKIFNSYGIKSTEIKNNFELDKKIKKVLNFKGPIMCNIKISPNARIVPKLKPGFPLHDMLPSLSRSEINEQMGIVKNW